MTPRGTQVHLGAGAFARGHTWLCTARAQREDGWGVVAVAQRSERVIGLLRQNRWAYTVVEADEDHADAHRVDVVTGGLVAHGQETALLASLADESTHVVTITATEAAYPRTPEGRLNRAAVAQDLDDGGVRTLIGQVVAAARERERAGMGGVSFVVCDNILRGGDVLRTLALEFALARGEEGAARWLTERATFPNAVVDRIVPAPTEDVIRAAQRLTGTADAAMVVTEPFFRWILQDSFAGPRPRWEDAGAVLVDSVAPWEAVKLNLVNAPHSLLAYLGLLVGHSTTHAAVGDPVLRRGLEHAFREDLVPAITESDGISPWVEAESSVRRFANPRIHHRLDQIGAGGAHKLSQRLSAPLQDASRRGRGAHWLALCLAAWAECGARGLVSDSPRADTGSWVERAAGVLQAAGLESVAPEGFASEIAARWDTLARRGAHAAVIELSESGES
ncbi:MULTISPECIES: mannitol dehydrogenase family protein [Microbacterium]|uniref:Mannitol dehydrogenase family protein n=1 Tax=Microbacterium wangchenii TaxID=2541726 RepID=A0ABX5SSW8_9MICO|nr:MULTISPECIES: mannitol dehydrogenase family protein [Microbacterium]MCK6065445.1 mannitol dehydrogenase family protein [Microbacterium sp. EYE_512]QBR88877.1 mannitol dehydrogenase family protein [Microbacterium wangchenii]